MHVSKKLRRSLRIGILGFGLAMGVSACTVPEEHALDRARPKAQLDTVALTLAAPPGAPSLLPDASARLADFASGHARSGRGPLEIEGSPDGIKLVEARLREIGFPAASIRIVSAPIRDLASDTVRVRYSRFTVVVPECGDWSTDRSLNPMNKLHPNFGCASVRDFGLMLADPSDLVAPRPSGDRDAARSDTIVRKYRAGEPTAAKPPQGEGDIRRGTIRR